MFALTFLIFFLRRIKIDKDLLIILFLITLVTALQFVIFENFVLNSLFSYIVIVGYAYFTVKLIGVNSIYYYINFIYFMSFVSFLFYIPSLLSDSFLNSLYNIVDFLGTDPTRGHNFLIYTVRSEITSFGVIRNSGFTYEPGMFASFLVVALMFNTLKTDNLWNKKNIIFIVCIITTFSTAGYIALLFFITGFYILASRSIMKFIATPIVIILSFFLFYNLDFMASKIEWQIERSGLLSGQYIHHGRVGSALFDLKDIAQFPLTGRGRSLETRYDTDDIYYLGGVNITHRTNGIFDLIAALGIPVSLYYFYRLYKSLEFITMIYNKRFFTVILFTTLILIAMSQRILFRPFFISLIFIYLNYYSQHKDINFEQVPNIDRSNPDAIKKLLPWSKTSPRECIDGKLKL